MRAWWAYWLTFGVGAVVWIAVAIAKPGGTMHDTLHQPAWLFLLIAPLVLAGANLVIFRRDHETVCSLEAERHRWLRMLVGRGYSATAFAATGVALLGTAAVILGGVMTGAW